MTDNQGDILYPSEEVKEPPFITEDEDLPSSLAITKMISNHSKYKCSSHENVLNSKSISFRDAFKNIKTGKNQQVSTGNNEQNLLEVDSFLKRDAKKAELAELNNILFENPLKKPKYDEIHKPRVKFLVNQNKTEDSEKTFFLRRDGDWICTECRNVNFSRRKKCNRCEKFKLGSEHLADYEINEEDVEKLYNILGKGIAKFTSLVT